MSEIDTRKIMHVKKSNFSFNRNLSSFYRTNKKNDDEISNVDTKQRNGYICFFFLFNTCQFIVPGKHLRNTVTTKFTNIQNP